MQDIVVSGAQEDVLAALLSQWWVANNALLFRREIVVKIGGWDENWRRRWLGLTFVWPGLSLISTAKCIATRWLR